jgi:putative ABC transport system permease protein
MLGIIIGVAAVVTMVAIGDGARERVASQIRSLGANLIGINQGSLTIGAVRLGAGAAQRLSEADAHDIEAEVPGTLALLGGAVGAFVGIGGALAIAKLAGWPVRVDLSTVLLAVAFAGGVGVFFGFYPARRAAQLDPIEALRSE